MDNILGYFDSCTFLEINKNIEYAIILFRTVGFIELFIYHIIKKYICEVNDYLGSKYKLLTTIVLAKGSIEKLGYITDLRFV